MLIFLDKDSLNVNVKCGALENYTATPEILDLVKKVTALKELKDKFMETELNPKLKEILDIVDKINVTANPELKAYREREMARAKKEKESLIQEF